jgi:hypothetical protein
MLKTCACLVPSTIAPHLPFRHVEQYILLQYMVERFGEWE